MALRSSWNPWPQVSPLWYQGREYPRLNHTEKRAVTSRLMLFGLRLPQERAGSVLGQEVEPDSLACCCPPPVQVVLKSVLTFLMSPGDCFERNEWSNKCLLKCWHQPLLVWYLLWFKGKLTQGEVKDPQTNFKLKHILSTLRGHLV